LSSLRHDARQARYGCGEPASRLGLIASAWGLVGTAALLGKAVWTLGLAGGHAIGSSEYPLAVWQWALAAAWLLAMCFFQGYLGLQRGFSPRVVVRACYLAGLHRPRTVDVLLAPLFCIGLLGASRKRLQSAWALVSIMVLLAFALRWLPQPYRGIIEAGVAAGLAWGLIALGIFAVRAMLGRPPETSPDLAS